MTTVNGSRSTLLRRHGRSGVTNTELFFDLVYVFAVTQLSHRLVEHLSVESVLHTALLLAMVWVVWMYTTWVTNWVDPERVPTRLMLLALMLGSLVLSAGLPDAFGERGLWVGASYAVMQIGRSAYAVWALQGDALQRNFQRITCWCVASGTLAVIGGLLDGHSRTVLWLGALVVDLAGGWAGFAVSGLGRSTTADWTIDGSHVAERCQAFLLIALGESVVVIGATLAGLEHIEVVNIGAFVAAFAGAVALWWIYFDRSAAASAQVAAAADDPGRLGRSAFHVIHPVMIGGIILTAAADERVLAEPLHHADAATAWLVLGGTGLFLLGHALFVMTVWRVVPWSRVVAVVVLAALFAVHGIVSALALGVATLVVVLAVILADAVSSRRGTHFAELSSASGRTPTDRER